MSVRISAVVCTRNRALYLHKALDSLAAQTLAPDSHEIIVVDNGSLDDTKEVFNSFSECVNWCYVYEPIIGVSRARNTAWRNARGEYVAFLDDDAIASPEWLAKYLDAFDRYGPGVGSIGGKVDLIWEAPKPTWLSNELLGILSLYDYSNVPLVLSEQQWMSICNLAYPKKVLEAVGGLREDLGRKGNKLLAGADKALRRELDLRGLRSIYHPDIVVRHHVSPARLTKSWFRKAGYWQGASAAIMASSADKPIGLDLRLAQTLQKSLWTLPRLGAMFVAPNQAERFRRQFQVIEAIGYLSCLWRGEE